MSRRLIRTSKVASVLGVTTGFVRGEVKEGRLRAAIVMARPKGRTLYRFDPDDLRVYCQRYSPGALDRLDTHI